MKTRAPKRVTSYRHHGPLSTHEGCDCASNPAGTMYYTSARRDDGRAIALTGPYVTHAEALEALPGARDKAYDYDPRAAWYAYGTFAAKPDAKIKVVFA